MNTRTNLRTWRQRSRYIIQVGIRGSQKNPHIYAEIKAIAADNMSEVVLINELGKFKANDKIYAITAKNPRDAVDKALKSFDIEKISQP